MKRFLFLLLGSIFLAGVLSVSAGAAPKVDDDSFFPQFKSDEDIKDARISQNLLNKGPQFGGWISPTLIDQRGRSVNMTSTVTTTRLWAKSALWDNSFIYIRGKYTFLGVIDQKGFDAKSTNHLVDLDVGFIAMSAFDQMVQLAVGRKYFILGSGLLFNGRADGAELNVNSPFLNLRAFGNYTGLLQKDDNPYGMSDKDITSGSRRLFFGGEASFDFFNQTVYFMGLGQLDYGREYYMIRSHYNSQYYGLGVRGVLIDNLSYYGEFINERGVDYINTSAYVSSRYVYLNQKTKINSYAGVANLSYFFDYKFNPVLLAQYYFGSGDRDRDNYKSPNGNIKGTDNGFSSFGTFVGGYALRPLIGNLHTIRVGAAASPFDWTDISYLYRMTVIAKYSYYLKNKASSGINMGVSAYGYEAPRNNRHVGQGVDLSLRWLILSDISTFVNWAVFIPGGAYYSEKMSRALVLLVPGMPYYGKKANRYFTMVGFNVSF